MSGGDLDWLQTSLLFGRQTETWLSWGILGHSRQSDWKYNFLHWKWYVLSGTVLSNFVCRPLNISLCSPREFRLPIDVCVSCYRFYFRVLHLEENRLKEREKKIHWQRNFRLPHVMAYFRSFIFWFPHKHTPQHTIVAFFLASQNGTESTVGGVNFLVPYQKHVQCP